MSFDPNTALDGAIALVETIPGIQSVQKGAPSRLAAALSIWVTLGDVQVDVRALSVYEATIDVLIWFGYAVGGDEATCEQKLAEGVGSLFQMLVQNRSQTVNSVTRNLNGSVTRMDVPVVLHTGEDYARFAGEERRIYPVRLTVRQQDTIN